MNRRTTFALSTMAVLYLGFALPGEAVAQTAKDLVGTWKQVSNVTISAESESMRPPIPRESGHPIRSKAATDSDRRRPPC
jgi:hypothetical protein